MELKTEITKAMESQDGVLYQAPCEGILFQSIGGEVLLDVDKIMEELGRVLARSLKLKERRVRDNPELENALSLVWERIMGSPYLGNMTKAEVREWIA